MLIANSSMQGIQEVKDMLAIEFDMKDVGEAKVILGKEIHRNNKDGSIMLHRKSHLTNVLERYNMGMSKPVSTPIKQGIELSVQQGPQTTSELFEI